MTITSAQSSSVMSAKHAAPRNGASLPKTKSADGLDRLTTGLQKNLLQCRPLQAVGYAAEHHHAQMAVPKKGILNRPDNLREVSRLELLLAPKKSKSVFVPVEDSLQSQTINKAIKMSGQWRDVQRAVVSLPEFSPGNAAYAVHRLGCLNSFASQKRKADLAASGLVQDLLDVAMSSTMALDVGGLTLILDGCARLRHLPPLAVLDGLAAVAQPMASLFDSTQLPLMLWAFSVLQYTPRNGLLKALDEAILHLGTAMSPQGICLVLSGFQAADYHPSLRTLNRLAESLHRMLLVFKPTEIATCLEAFTHFGYQPADHIIAAILHQTGQSLHTNQTGGKQGLAQSAPNSADG